MERWGIIYSPRSGSGRTHKRWEQIARLLHHAGVQYDFVQSESHGAESRLAAMLANNGYRTIVVAGCDGALCHAVNGVASLGSDALSRTHLGVIPGGRRNDFAAWWGLSPDNPELAIKALAAGRVRRVDLGQLRQQEQAPLYFLNCVNVGPAAGAPMIWQGKESRVQFTVNHQSHHQRMITMCVGNCHGYGLTPSANPYSGTLDLTVVTAPPITQWPRALRLLWGGRIHSFGCATAHRTRDAITVTDTGGAKVSLDGMPMPTLAAPFTISLIPQALNFIIP